MLRTTTLEEQETVMTARTPPVAATSALTEETTREETTREETAKAETTKKETSATRAERRYDPKTIEAAVALASRMQAEHQESLSSKELEAIAAEAGIRPEFVRRALSLLEENPLGVNQKEVQTVPVAVKRKVRTRQTTGARRLTRRQKKLIFIYPLLYAILAFFPLLLGFVSGRHGQSGGSFALLMLLVLILPTALIVALGAKLNRKRQGAVAGALVGAALFFSALMAGLASGENMGGDPGGFFAAFALMTGFGAFLGFASAWLKQAMPFWLGADPADPIEEEAEAA